MIADKARNKNEGGQSVAFLISDSVPLNSLGDLCGLGVSGVPMGGRKF
jgi:hypothetical protein